MQLIEQLRKKGVAYFNIGWGRFRLSCEEKVELDGEELDGLTDFSERKISISGKLDYAGQRHTLIHEIWHVILSGMWMDDRTKEYGAESGVVRICNEDLAENSARGMMLFQNLNPQLWDVLFSQYRP